MKYVISRKSNVLIPYEVDTKNSIYPVMEYKPFRKFKTRAAARSYKRSLAKPVNYVIVDTVANAVVR